MARKSLTTSAKTVRLPNSLWERIRITAEQAGHNPNMWIRKILGGASGYKEDKDQ